MHVSGGKAREKLCTLEVDTNAWAQGFETFESCFRTLAGHNLLPYSVEDTGEVVGPLFQEPP